MSSSCVLTCPQPPVFGRARVPAGHCHPRHPAEPAHAQPLQRWRLAQQRQLQPLPPQQCHLRRVVAGCRIAGSRADRRSLVCGRRGGRRRRRRRREQVRERDKRDRPSSSAMAGPLHVTAAAALCLLAVMAFLCCRPCCRPRGQSFRAGLAGLMSGKSFKVRTESGTPSSPPSSPTAAASTTGGSTTGGSVGGMTSRAAISTMTGTVSTSTARSASYRR